MNILSKVIENVTKNFEQSLNIYHLNDLFNAGIVNDFNHYINMIKSIDYVSYNFSTDLYKQFLKNVDESFFNSSYRKSFCEVIKFDERNIITFFGEVRFRRRYYYDTFKKRKFYFVDETLMLPKGLRFDPFVCAKICEVSSHDSYAKAGRTVSELIGKRLKFYEDPDRYLINRATARKIVLRFNIPKIPFTLKDTPKILYVMLDEKFVHSQFNNGDDWMVKAAVVFEDVDVVYKSKKKKDSINRYKLLGKHVLASIDNDLQKQVIDYIYYSYKTDEIEEIVFMGDCAKWIKAFKDGFKFHPKLKITFSIDGYHYAQALQHICTNKYDYFLDSFKEVIKDNDKQGFINLCNVIIEYEPHRLETITDKQNYILNNWKFIQNYYHKVFVKCSMESHISHCFADIFTSRPRAYSYKGLKQLLKLRLLKVNNLDIQKIYFEVLNKEYDHKNILDSSCFTSYNSKITYNMKRTFNCYEHNNKVFLC